MMRTLIGLAGKAGSGKNHIGTQLALGDYIPLSLAGPMKAQLAAQGVIPGDEAIEAVKRSVRTRRFLQHQGDVDRQRFGTDYYCRQLEWWIAWFMSNGGNSFVITDIRYPNEVDWIRSLGGLVIRVVGRGGLEGPEGQHASETALDAYKLPEVVNHPEVSDSLAITEIHKLVLAHYTGKSS